jgi:hypothetical protein
MPFRSLAGRKKLGNLGAEIVALAPFESAAILAAFTTDPVQVAVYPYAGGTPKVKTVSLDSAGDGALLNRDVAIVKSGTDLWSLLDIQHRPGVDQVGRDIRSLHDNPRGETALAIGWDGQGAELKVRGRDVGGRQFELRGEVRAASLDGTSCYVVVEGPGGGKLREHPGGTPESGTQVRCDLPAEALGMTRLAGGKRLSALCQRGGSKVCIVRKIGAAGLEARMLLVDGGVADVAVIDTSLFVLGADDKLRLFDAETLAQAGGEIAAARFEIALGADAAATVMAATTQGGNRLWIGTKDGEVLRFDAVKGGVSLPL